MKDSFIREFYYGNLTPDGRNMPGNYDLGKACNALCEAETTMTATLTGAEKKLRLWPCSLPIPKSWPSQSGTATILERLSSGGTGNAGYLCWNGIKETRLDVVPAP